MFVQFSQDIGSWKAGDIVDLPDGVGRAFVAGQQAVESNAVAHLQASTAAEMARFKAELMETVRGAIKPAATQQTQMQHRTPPNGGGGVQFDRIEATGNVADQGKRSFTDALRCVFLVNAAGVPPELHTYARNRLRGYSDEFTEYSVNQDSGQIEERTTRQLAGGGIETITRTGTDSISGGSTYGFTLKPDYIGSLFRIAREQEVFASMCRKIPVTQGNECIWPNLDQFKAPTTVNGIPQAAVFGGITLSYVGETTARVSSDGAVDENRYKVVDLTGMTDFSRDYIVDNYIAMDTEIVSQFGNAIAWVEDWVTMRGDGVAKPQGFFNANALISGGGVADNATRAVANKIVYEDLAWMVSRLASQCWPRARFITNTTCIPQLMAIANAAGTYVYQPNAMISQAMQPSIIGQSSYDEAALVSRPSGTLLGFPVYVTEKVPTLGATGDISLVCPYEYGLAERSGLEVGVSDQFYFSTDRIAYRFKKRHFGKSLWRAAYTQADASATGAVATATTVSPFVTLVHL